MLPLLFQLRFSRGYFLIDRVLRLCPLLGLVAAAAGLGAQSPDQALTDVFLPSERLADPVPGYAFTTEYTPTTSTWAVSDAFSEELVFQSEMSYTDPDHPARSYQLRVGKGGQIYSLRGAFGESVPPQWRKPQANGETDAVVAGSYAPWVDEVWQMVAVDNAKNKPAAGTKYFIHQAGVYLKTPEQKTPYYSPVVAAHHDPDRQAYSIVNWGQQAHTGDNVKGKFRSDILYYTTYTNLGDGVIQVDNMIYNFGDDVINHVNAPWGGVRTSSLGHFFVSDQDNNYAERVKRFGEAPQANRTRETGGWLAYAGAADGEAPAFGIVVSRDESVGPSLYRHGYAGTQRFNSARDYNVFTITRRLAERPVTFGRSVSFRYYYVVGASVEDVKATILRHRLVERTGEHNDTPAKNEVSDLHYRLAATKDGTITAEPTDHHRHALTLKARPYQGSYPLFLLTGADGTQRLTTDQYHYSELPYDGKLQAIRLLGFADRSGEIEVNGGGKWRWRAD